MIVTSRKPNRASWRRTTSMIGIGSSSPRGISGLGRTWVYGRSRVPLPPARSTACMSRSFLARLSSRSSDPTRRAGDFPDFSNWLRSASRAAVPTRPPGSLALARVRRACAPSCRWRPPRRRPSSSLDVHVERLLTAQPPGLGRHRPPRRGRRPSGRARRSARPRRRATSGRNPSRPSVISSPAPFCSVVITGRPHARASRTTSEQGS